VNGCVVSIEGVQPEAGGVSGPKHPEDAAAGQGQGQEPQLELSSSVLELGPTLPFSAVEETDVLIWNPCLFPIEF
jgi:hypothetical protein